VVEQLAVALSVPKYMARRTYADRAEYIKAAVSKRRNKIKQLAIKYLGGACQICGYNRTVTALDFHHRNSKVKEFGLAQDGLTRSWKRTRKELDKRVLLGANCHREIHAGISAASRRKVGRKTG